MTINKKVEGAKVVLEREVVSVLKQTIDSCYGLNIEKAKFYYSTTNCAFIFEGQPFMVRVSFHNAKSKAEIINETMWVDDLKSIADTICEPKPSLNNKLVEEVDIGGQTYRISMFRTAKGNLTAPKDMSPLFFICVGDLMGKIHHVSCDEQLIGMHFKRQSMDDSFLAGYRLAFKDEKQTTELMKEVLDVAHRVKEIERTPENYGLCHCDLHSRNFFADGNNIWLFDFDSCMYADYMYDIATFILMSIISGYGRGKGKDVKSLIYEDMIPYIKIGYELNKTTKQTDWEKIDLFIRYRLMNMHMHLTAIDDCGVVEDLNRIKGMFSYLVNQKEENLYDAMTKILLL